MQNTKPIQSMCLFVLSAMRSAINHHMRAYWAFMSNYIFFCCCSSLWFLNNRISSISLFRFHALWKMRLTTPFAGVFFSLSVSTDRKSRHALKFAFFFCFCIEFRTKLVKKGYMYVKLTLIQCETVPGKCAIHFS